MNSESFRIVTTILLVGILCMSALCFFRLRSIDLNSTSFYNNAHEKYLMPAPVKVTIDKDILK